MTVRERVIDWENLLGRADQPFQAADFSNLHEDQCVLISGAGGSIGSSLARAIAQLKPRCLVLLDCSEYNLFRIDAQLSSIPSLHRIAVLGSVTDEVLLREIFQQQRPDIVYHAAACKHVPLLEANPCVAILTNVIGTSFLVSAARQHGTGRVILVSTDKAVYPRSIMGVSKRIAEMLLLADDAGEMRGCVVRLGNVLASDGSVAATFMQQIERGGPVTVTHPDARRFFISMHDAVHSILSAARADARAIFVPGMGDAIRIADLAHYMISSADLGPIAIACIGLRPGDKLCEDLVYRGETLASQTHQLSCYTGPTLSWNELQEPIVALQRFSADRNLPGILQTVSQLVPEYSPSEALLNLASSPVRR